MENPWKILKIHGKSSKSMENPQKMFTSPCLIEAFRAHQLRVHPPAPGGWRGHVDPVDAARLGAALDGGNDLLRHAIPGA